MHTVRIFQYNGNTKCACATVDDEVYLMELMTFRLYVNFQSRLSEILSHDTSYYYSLLKVKRYMEESHL